MAFLLSNYSNALQTILLPFIRDNLPKETIMLDQLKRNVGVEMMNDNFYAPLRTARHGGITSLATDDSSINSSNGSSYGRASVGVKLHTGAFDISKLAIEATRSNKQAVQSSLTQQTKTLVSDFARDICRQLYSDGVGVVSQVAGSVGAGTASVKLPNASLDDGRSIDHYGTVNGDISPTKYFAPGQIVGIGTGAADLGTITAVTGTSIVMTGAPAIVADDAIYKVDGSGLGAGSAELTGVAAALSSSTGTSTYAGVARNVVGWTPQFGSTSEALNLPAMEDTYLSAREYGQKGDTFAILVNKTLYRKFGDILTSMRRNVNSLELVGGWSGLEFIVGEKKVAVILDYDVPDGEVLFINLDTWTLCQVDDMGWMEDPSQGSMLRISNTIKYQAVMTWFFNVLCLAPAANGRQTQKTD